MLSNLHDSYSCYSDVQLLRYSLDAIRILVPNLIFITMRQLHCLPCFKMLLTIYCNIDKESKIILDKEWVLFPAKN
jgi:hypothetical protein